VSALITIQPRIDFDSKRISEVAKAIGVTMKFFVTDQMRLLGLDLISITAPSKKLYKKDEVPRGSDKKIGEGAINADLMKLFHPIKDAAAVVAWVQKGGQITTVTNSGKMVVDADQLQATKSKMDEWVRKFRSTRTGRIKFPRQDGKKAFVGKLLVPNQLLIAYVKERHRHVGTLKAGWLKGAKFFASKCNGKAKTAPWIESNLNRAMGGGGGNIDDDANGKIFIENTSPFAQAKTRDSMILFALNTRRKDIDGQAEKRGKRILDQFNGIGSIKPIKAA
jgi:hypothetical protein